MLLRVVGLCLTEIASPGFFHKLGFGRLVTEAVALALLYVVLTEQSVCTSLPWRDPCVHMLSNSPVTAKAAVAMPMKKAPARAQPRWRLPWRTIVELVADRWQRGSGGRDVVANVQICRVERPRTSFRDQGGAAVGPKVRPRSISLARQCSLPAKRLGRLFPSHSGVMPLISKLTDGE